MQAKALPGFRDFYPDDAALRAHIFHAWREVATRYGFVAYDGPPLEPLELYTHKSGPEIVEQLYAFEDKGGRKVALRPEMTPTLARMVAARANGLKKPIRWFSTPQLFRYERQQRGRLREHFQLNCDLIGESGPQADTEIIALGIDILRTLGLTADEVRVRLSDRRVLAALLLQAGVPPTALTTAYQIVDKLERLSPEAAAEQFQKAGLESSESRIRSIASVRGFDALLKELTDVGEEVVGGGLRTIVDGLAAQGLGDYIEIDLTIVRGLAYYTGPVFEIFDVARSFRAICGGGRYDGLLNALGGVDLPACGFGMGDVVLAELLREHRLVPSDALRLDCFVVGVTEEDQSHVLALAHELREAGLRTEFSLTHAAVGKQLKLADARQSQWAILIGPDDRARGEVMVKDLGAKMQQAVARHRVVTTLRQQRQGTDVEASVHSVSRSTDGD